MAQVGGKLSPLDHGVGRVSSARQISCLLITRPGALPLEEAKGVAETDLATRIDFRCQTGICLTNWLILTSVSQTETLLKGRTKKKVIFNTFLFLCYSLSLRLQV